jgi:hypothetical protein
MARYATTVDGTMKMYSAAVMRVAREFVDAISVAAARACQRRRNGTFVNKIPCCTQTQTSGKPRVLRVQMYHTNGGVQSELSDLSNHCSQRSNRCTCS